MIIFALIVFLGTLTLTGLLRRYALAKNIIDIPNHRSSHTIPTPRGGGFAFVIVFLAALLFLRFWNFIALDIFIALASAGTLIAALGFLDDHYNLSARWRLLGHIAASFIALYTLGGMPELKIAGWILPAGLLMNILTLFYLVWFINLYNFMDGINGLAAIEALCIALGGAVLYYAAGHQNLTILPLILTAAVTGFLYWNFPRARIFMGDVGSGFLGVILSVLSIQAAKTQPSLFWSWLILAGVFIVDATFTLLHRLLQGEKIYEAHCQHAYQQAARQCNSHVNVSLSVAIINLFWLFPLAVMVAKKQLDGVFGVVIAYLPLIALAFYLRAGKSE